MIDNRSNNRFLNIFFCIAGLIACIGSGLVNAPEGLLPGEAGNILQSLPADQLLLMFVLPSLLMLAALVLVVMQRGRALTVITVLGGTVLYALMDVRYTFSHQAFTGILINMLGVILMLTGVALEVLATEKVVRVRELNTESKMGGKPREVNPYISRYQTYEDLYITGDTGTVVDAADDVPSDSDDEVLMRLRDIDVNGAAASAGEDGGPNDAAGRANHAAARAAMAGTAEFSGAQDTDHPSNNGSGDDPGSANEAVRPEDAEFAARLLAEMDAVDPADKKAATHVDAGDDDGAIERILLAMEEAESGDEPVQGEEPESEDIEDITAIADMFAEGSDHTEQDADIGYTGRHDIRRDTMSTPQPQSSIDFYSGIEEMFTGVAEEQ